jgi:glycolate oxidase iron-sulfur subunit
VLSGQLRANKLAALEAGRPEVIATANIGCLAHLGARAQQPVRHWIELLESRLRGDERRNS